MQKNKLLAYGRKSEIYDLNDGKVLKLYCMGFPSSLVNREFQSTRVVQQQTNLAVPKPLAMRKISGRSGIVFEKISGQAYMDLFMKNPIRYFTEAGILAKIHSSIHSYKPSGLPTQMDIFANVIKKTNRVSVAEKERLLDLLSKPRSLFLCHGDFHHGNVILNQGKHYLLDWMDAFVGDPALDIALTAVNAAVSDAPDFVPFVYRKLYDWLKKVMALDSVVLRHHPEVVEDEWPKYLMLAAGIHLARKEGSHMEHRKYFDKYLFSNS